MEKTLQKVKTISIKMGMKAALGVILDKAEQEDKDDSQKITEIREYCKKALGVVNGKTEAVE